MTPRQVQKILSLLHSYWPNSKQLKSSDTVQAWAAAIKRFPYGDVKTAIVDYAVDHKFFPDVYDITCDLKEKARRRAQVEAQRRRMAEFMEEAALHHQMGEE